MAVDLTLLNSNSINNIETNFERVETALQDAVSRSGTTPNQMTADLDMNSNDILNINLIDAQALTIDGNPIVDIPAFETIEANIPDIITVSDNISSVVTVAANISDINTVIVNLTDIQNAEENALLAKNYANAAEDVEVEPGFYSAFHWSEKAAETVAEFPSGVALNYLRRNAGNTAYENRTPAQVRTDISAKQDIGEKDFWLRAGITGNILAGRGISSVVDDGAGLITINFSTAFASATSYAINSTVYDATGSGQVRNVTITGRTTGSAAFKCVNASNTIVDPVEWNFMGIGT